MNKGTKFVLKSGAIIAVSCPLTVIIYCIFFPEQIPLGIFLSVSYGIVYLVGLAVGYDKGRRDALEEQKADEEDTPEEGRK